MALRVKKAKSRWIQLSFLPWILRMIASTVISLVVYITAVLCSPNVENLKRGWLLQFEILILDFHLRDCRLLVWPSRHSAQPVSCAIWCSSAYLEPVAILRRPSCCGNMCLCSQVRATSLWIDINLKANAYFISDPEGQYGENLVGHLFFSKIERWFTAE